MRKDNSKEGSSIKAWKMKDKEIKVVNIKKYFPGIRKDQKDQGDVKAGLESCISSRPADSLEIVKHVTEVEE